jgi:tetratricopeptide (TPR) repeat protein
MDNARDELALVDTLSTAGATDEDEGEPSWCVLAQMAREVRFVQTLRRLAFMTDKWSVPVDDYWADIKRFVARHRYYAYLESLVLPPREARDALARLAKGFDPTDIETKEHPLTWQIREAGLPLGQSLWALAASHCESGAADIASILERTAIKKVETAEILLALSPYSAFAMAALNKHDWDKVQGDIAGWREKVRDHPALLAALGKKYSELKRFDEAQKCLARYVEQSSDRWAYDALAACFLASGDVVRWRSTLDDYLTKTENAGLEHAKVRVKIADRLMEDGRYAEAWPYAEAAAQTWAGWAMICPQNCAEGLKKWETAEGYARASSERYPWSMWAVWFLFCGRTGHGDIAAAFLESPDLSVDTLILISYVQLVCGDKAKAAVALRRVPKEDHSQVYATSLAAAADLAGATEVRDAALERFCTAFQKASPRAAKVFQMIRDAIAAKNPGESI